MIVWKHIDIYMCGVVDYVHIRILLGRFLAIYVQRHMEEMVLVN